MNTLRFDSHRFSFSPSGDKLYKQWWVTNSDIHLPGFTYAAPDFAEAANFTSCSSKAKLTYCDKVMWPADQIELKPRPHWPTNGRDSAKSGLAVFYIYRLHNIQSKTDGGGGEGVRGGGGWMHGFWMSNYNCFDLERKRTERIICRHYTFCYLANTFFFFFFFFYFFWTSYF